MCISVIKWHLGLKQNEEGRVNKKLKVVEEPISFEEGEGFKEEAISLDHIMRTINKMLKRLQIIMLNLKLDLVNI